MSFINPNIKQDYINLIEMDKNIEYRDNDGYYHVVNSKEHALLLLKELAAVEDTKIILKEVDTKTGNETVKEIDNPSPLHIQKGFKEWMEMPEKIAETTKEKIDDVISEIAVITEETKKTNHTEQPIEEKAV